MPTITREKAMKNQSLAPTGWNYDWRYFVIWGENQLKRNIPQNDGTIIEAVVRWDAIYETKTNDYGCKWNVKTGEFSLNLSVRRWHQGITPDVMESSGLGKTIELDSKGYPRRNYKDLCKFAGAVTDDLIMKTLAS